MYVYAIDTIHFVSSTSYLVTLNVRYIGLKTHIYNYSLHKRIRNFIYNDILRMVPGYIFPFHVQKFPHLKLIASKAILMF